MWPILKQGKAPVFFITLHKCASTLFADHILPQSQNYLHCDYASKIFNNLPYDLPLDFSQKNMIYGPIRVHTDFTSSVPRHVVLPLLQPELYKTMHAIFLVRDPRDVLVSRYYSLLNTHVKGKTPESQKTISYLKDSTSALSIDEYVLSESHMIEQCYRIIIFLYQNCKQATLLKYEDMIHDFEVFYSQLDSVLCLPQTLKQEIYEQSRPQIKETPVNHKRSGKTEGYKEKLQHRTIECLNQIYSRVLPALGYTTKPSVNPPY